MTKLERMKEIAKANPGFGKRVGYKMCVIDELHDMKELEKENAELKEHIENIYANHCGNCNRNILNTRLKKENAELKEQNKKLLESCEGATMMYEDLCKAKEIIKKMSYEYQRLCLINKETLTEAEQFIKNIEV